jgi:tetratricopeptide (TPR) repeat protein
VPVDEPAHIFDVFLSYSSMDQACVEKIARRLVDEGGVRLFLDAWDLVPGEPWQEKLEQALGESATCAVFVGPSGVGPWANEELRAALDDRARNPSFRVIPVLLPGAVVDGTRIPRFLRRLTWCDFRAGLDDADAFRRLLAGIRGARPGPTQATPSATPRSRDGALLRLGVAPYAWRRRSLLEETVRWIRVSHLPVVVRGLAGIGKTTLLYQAALELKEDVGHFFVIPFEGPASIEPGYVLEELNDFLNGLGRGMERAELWERSQAKTFELLVDDFVDLGVLMLFDAVDLAPRGWERRLLVDLARVPGVRVAATVGHGTPAGVTAHVVSVPPLEADEATELVEFMSGVLGVRVEPEELVAQLPAAVASHPQALVTLLSHLRDLPLDLLLRDRLPEDATAPALLAEQAIASVDERDRAALAVAEVLSGADLTTAMAVLDFSLPQGFRDSVELLQARSLLHRRENALVVSALIRGALAVVDEAAREAAASHVARDLGRTVDDAQRVDEQAVPLADLTVQIAYNLADAGRWSEVAAIVRMPLMDRLNELGLWKEYTALVRVGLNAAAELGDVGVEVELGLRLARKLRQMGDVEGAYDVLFGVEEVIGADGDSLEHAKLYDHRALLRGLDDDPDSALADLHRSREIREKSGDTEGLVAVHKVIGNVHLRRGDHGSAREAYEAALSLAHTEASEKHRLEAETSLAVCDLAADRPGEAEARLRQVIERAERRRYQTGLARAQVTLALALERQRRSREALAAARAAVAAAPADPDIARAAELVAWRLALDKRGAGA